MTGEYLRAGRKRNETSGKICRQPTTGCIVEQDREKTAQLRKIGKTRSMKTKLAKSKILTRDKQRFPRVRGTFTGLHLAMALLAMLAVIGNASAATASSATITSVTTTTTFVSGTTATVTGSGPVAGSSYKVAQTFNLTYEGEVVGVSSFFTGSGDSTVQYNPLAYEGIVKTTLVRSATGQSNNIVYQRNGGTDPFPGNTVPVITGTLAGPYVPNEQDVFNTNNLNLGTDNLFQNTADGNGNNNNIERVDVVFDLGLTVDEALAFLVIERGLTGGHDGFQIAAITSIDGSGNPTSFGTLVTFGTGTYGQADLNSDATTNWLITRNLLANPGGDAAHPSSNATQPLGGTTIAVAALIADRGLGIALGSTIYGYSLFATDVNGAASQADLLNVNSTAYNHSTGASGGIDLTAYTGVALTAVPEPTTCALFAIGGMSVLFFRRRSRRS